MHAGARMRFTMRRGDSLAYSRLRLAGDHSAALAPARSRRTRRGASKKDILELTEKLNVRFLRLQFTDILGINKNVEIPASQFEKALAGDIMFDGSSIEGFVRIEESDMLLAPDLSTRSASSRGAIRTTASAG